MKVFYFEPHNDDPIKTEERMTGPHVDDLISINDELWHVTGMLHVHDHNVYHINVFIASGAPQL